MDGIIPLMTKNSFLMVWSSHWGRCFHGFTMESQELGEAVAAAHWSQAKTEVGSLESQKSAILLSKMWISWVSEFYLWTCTKSMDCWGEVWPVFSGFCMVFDPPNFDVCFLQIFPETRPILRHTILIHQRLGVCPEPLAFSERMLILYISLRRRCRERENILNRYD